MTVRRPSMLDATLVARPEDPRSSSPAAAAASARRPPRRRWRCSAPRPAGARSCSPSTRPGGWRSRWDSPSSTTPPRGRRASKGELFAMMLDMKRTFDEVVLDALDARARRADLRQPLLPVAVLVVRRHAGVHGDGEARPARREQSEWDLIVVDTPPSRSALDFLDAPQPARPLPGRPDDPAAHHAGPGRRQGLPQGRHRGLVGMFARVVSRRSWAASCSATSRRSSARSRRCSAGSGSAPSTPTSCSRRPARRSSWSRRPSRTRCARRPTSSSACRTSGCRSPGWSSTGTRRIACRRARAAHRRPRRGRRGRARRQAGRPGPGPRRGGAARARRDRRPPPTTTSGWRDGSPPRTPSVPLVAVPALPTDVHDLDGLRAIGDAARRLSAAPSADRLDRRAPVP